MILLLLHFLRSLEWRIPSYSEERRYGCSQYLFRFSHRFYSGCHLHEWHFATEVDRSHLSATFISRRCTSDDIQLSADNHSASRDLRTASPASLRKKGPAPPPPPPRPAKTVSAKARQAPTISADKPVPSATFFGEPWSLGSLEPSCSSSLCLFPYLIDKLKLRLFLCTIILMDIFIHSNTRSC